jgi:hypothetical protein
MKKNGVGKSHATVPLNIKISSFLSVSAFVVFSVFLNVSRVEVLTKFQFPRT